MPEPMMSPTVVDLIKALHRAQGMFKVALKTAENPYYHCRYADLQTVQDAAKEALQANGLCVVQTFESGPDPTVMTLTTTLFHVSGQWIRGTLSLRALKNKDGEVTPQAIGSAATYARRYSYAAILGIVSDEDDDGNMASFTKPAAKATAARSEGLEAVIRQNDNEFAAKLGAKPDEPDEPDWIRKGAGAETQAEPKAERQAVSHDDTPSAKPSSTPSAGAPAAQPTEEDIKRDNDAGRELQPKLWALVKTLAKAKNWKEKEVLMACSSWERDGRTHAAKIPDDFWRPARGHKDMLHCRIAWMRVTYERLKQMADRENVALPESASHEAS